MKNYFVIVICLIFICSCSKDEKVNFSGKKYYRIIEYPIPGRSLYQQLVFNDNSNLDIVYNEIHEDDTFFWKTDRYSFVYPSKEKMIAATIKKAPYETIYLDYRQDLIYQHYYDSTGVLRKNDLPFLKYE